MKQDRIYELLSKYFEGETSCKEEKELQKFFEKKDIPNDLESYRPIFAYFERESKQHRRKKAEKPTGRRVLFKRSLVYALSGAAAGILLVLGITEVNERLIEPQNYVIIDGHRCTDICLAREQAKEAFSEVSFSEEEIFEVLFNE